MATIGIYIAIVMGMLIPILVLFICLAKDTPVAIKIFGSLFIVVVFGGIGYFAFALWMLHMVR